MTVDLPTYYDNWFEDFDASNKFNSQLGTINPGAKVAGSIPLTNDASQLNVSAGTGSGGDHGVRVDLDDTPASHDMTDEIFIHSWQANAPNRIQLETNANEGHNIRFYTGTGSTNFREWRVGGRDTDPHVLARSFIWVIDGGAATNGHADTGTYDATDVFSVAWTFRRLNMSGSNTPLHYTARGVLMSRARSGTNQPILHGTVDLKDLYDDVFGLTPAYNTINHLYTIKLGGAYFYAVPLTIGKAATTTVFDDEGIVMFSPGSNVGGAKNFQLTAGSMSWYIDNFTSDDTALFTGSYFWGTASDWFLDPTAGAVTFTNPVFDGMGDFTVDSAVTGPATFQNLNSGLGDVIVNGADLDGSTFNNINGVQLDSSEHIQTTP